jgi:predicted AAA+ superfamily ATPase
MKFIPRAISAQIQAAAKAFSIVLLTGPRQAGKTTLLRSLWPRADYILLEDPDVVVRVNADPRSFLETLTPPVILDEIQNTPQLLNYIRARVDRAPRRRGQWLMTGSQEAPMMRGVTESLAGRAGVLQLLPLSSAEAEKVSVLRGGFPGVLARPSAARLWFQSYIQTYLERDVRAVTQSSWFRRISRISANV